VSLHPIKPELNTLAVVLSEPRQLELRELALTGPGDADVIVEMEWSGISTGTERLLWSGKMPAFPGMGYPLVPGYEGVGRIASAGAHSGRTVGERVFVPGARCYGEIRGLFGSSAARVVVPGAHVTPVDERLGERATLLALAATALHALKVGSSAPQLIIGHGVLGRLIARLALLHGGGAAPVVWETNPARRAGAAGYTVIDPAEDPRRDYLRICDVSGDGGLLNGLIGRLGPRGEIVLAGFYSAPLSFDFAPAFMREAQLRIAAQWQKSDLAEVRSLSQSGELSLDGLITHHSAAIDATRAYRTAFEDAACLKMILDWRNAA
jgi:3-hydroxyethyl bacteriochlorophyllide a dehydrogenase